MTPAEHSILSSAMGAVQTELYLERFRKDVRPFPGAAAAIRAMRREGIPVVLASSARKEVIRRSLALLGLNGVLSGETRRRTSTLFV
ncbi:MAG: hypothetical protein ABI682_15080 [Acidobacteriota bacterium]